MFVKANNKICIIFSIISIIKWLHIFILLHLLQNLYIKLMHRQKSKGETKLINQSFNQKRILTSDFTPITFDPKLTSNPFLRDQPKFHYLVHQIKEYNKKVLSGAVKDNYQMMVYAKLFSLISSLSNIETREDQVERLNEVYDWLIKQDKLINQRKSQGDVRYKILSHEQAENSSIEPQIKKKRFSLPKQPGSMLPCEYLSKEALPFEMNWRTTHKQLETADQRIKQYKRKILNLEPVQDFKQEKKLPRVLYPKVGRYNWVKEYEIEENPQIQGQQQNPENPQSNIQNPQKPPQGVEGQKPIQQPAQNQQGGQDLGLGEEPQDEEPEEEQQKEGEDKLAPRLKSFIYEGRKEEKQERFSRNRMNERYLKVQNDFTKKKSEQQQYLQIMHQWGARKSKIEKDILRRIQDLGISSRYSFSKQAPPSQQKINPEDQIKFGLAKTMPIKQIKPALDMSSDFALPKINKNKKMYEKTIRNDRLKCLKKKFGAMLNLKESEDKDEKEQPYSLCNTAPKRFGFSQILERHSKEKQRLIQLDEITLIKQKLARSKINIDVKTLSMSMCAPEDEENLPVGTFPAKDLPTNPFWVQPAKKKKKKK